MVLRLLQSALLCTADCLFGGVRRGMGRSSVERNMLSEKRTSIMREFRCITGYSETDIDVLEVITDN
jgi:hypothetical protein